MSKPSSVINLSAAMPREGYELLIEPLKEEDKLHYPKIILENIMGQIHMSIYHEIPLSFRTRESNEPNDK